MDCEQVREALSARIDGEEPPVAAAQVDSHVRGCPGCARWWEQAQQVTRAVRLQPLRVPDLTAPVLAAVAADQQARSRPRPAANVLRLAVAVAAIVQLTLALPLILGADGHVSREMAAFEVALAVGFGLAAWRPQWAQPLVPVALVLAAGLVVTSGVDIAGAGTTWWHETGHLAAAMQAGLLWLLARHTPAQLATRQAAAA